MNQCLGWNPLCKSRSIGCFRRSIMLILFIFKMDLHCYRRHHHQHHNHPIISSSWRLALVIINESCRLQRYPLPLLQLHLWCLPAAPHALLITFHSHLWTITINRDSFELNILTILMIVVIFDPYHPWRSLSSTWKREEILLMLATLWDKIWNSTAANLQYILDSTP